MSGLRPILLLLCIAAGPFVHAQRAPAKIQNLGGFDTRPHHFGVQLSYNTADFFLKRNFDPNFTDSLTLLQHRPLPGFNIAIIASLNMTKNLSLRFIPGISPKERTISYSFLRADGRALNFEKVVSSFYIDLPLNLQYRTDRINNFAAYVIAGGQLSRDMASQEKVNNVRAGIEDQVVKIKRLDYLINAGGGFDFFLPYFKFGIEFKMAYGLNNLLIQDGTSFSTPIESLKSRNFVLSFTFEG
jgi:hypothetical protein